MKKRTGWNREGALVMHEIEAPWLHRFCVTLSVATFFLVIAGGLVTSTDSGLAVPDWPLSYGQLMPPMVGGIFYEHGHRVVATVVGILTMGLVVWLWKVERRLWVKRLGLVALLAVVVQGVLGGLTVLYLLPTAVSVSHATLAQSFFGLTILVALVTSRSWKETPGNTDPGLGRMKTMSLLSLCAIFIQLILGALMRHSGAGLAVPDFPLAYGHLWPSLNTESVASINEIRIGWELPPVDSTQIAIHMVHRVWAAVVVFIVIATFREALRADVQRSIIREPAILLFVLVLFQTLLGALTVWSGKSIEVATAHVAVGALLFGSAVVLTARCFRLSASRRAEFATILATEGTKA